MHVSKVVFSKTVQVQRYEPERIELTIDLNEGDTVGDAVSAARRTCSRLLGLTPSADEIEAAKRVMSESEGRSFD